MCLYLVLSRDSICGEVITFPGSGPLIKQTDSNYTGKLRFIGQTEISSMMIPNFMELFPLLRWYWMQIYDGAHFFQNLSNSWKELLNAHSFYTFIQYKWARIKLYLFSCLGIQKEPLFACIIRFWFQRTRNNAQIVLKDNCQQPI